MAADPLGTSDGHFLEVMPDFLSEAKETGPNEDKGCHPRAKENTNSKFHLVPVELFLCSGDWRRGMQLHHLAQIAKGFVSQMTSSAGNA